MEYPEDIRIRRNKVRSWMQAYVITECRSQRCTLSDAADEAAMRFDISQETAKRYIRTFIREPGCNIRLIKQVRPRRDMKPGGSYNMILAYIPPEAKGLIPQRAEVPFHRDVMEESK